MRMHSLEIERAMGLYKQNGNYLPERNITKMNKIKKMLIKIFMPSADQIADIAVNAAADFINESDKTETIAKYGTVADDFTKI